MGKVRELISAWVSCGKASTYLPLVVQHTRDAVDEDEADHAAELEAKDVRIRELEAELAKRELPPLPDDIRAIVDQFRRSHLGASQAEKLIAWIDSTFPAPVPQWELDARALEGLGILDIAARIREAGRGNSK